MAIPRPRMHLRYAQPRIPVYLSRAQDIRGFLAYRDPNYQFFLPQEFTRSGAGLLNYPQLLEDTDLVVSSSY
jgi:hypothetical protein